MCRAHLGNVIDSEQGVADQERLYGTQLMGGSDVPRAIECPGRVLAQHCMERLKRRHFLCSLGVLPRRASV